MEQKDFATRVLKLLERIAKALEKLAKDDDGDNDRRSVTGFKVGGTD